MAYVFKLKTSHINVLIVIVTLTGLFIAFLHTDTYFEIKSFLIQDNTKYILYWHPLWEVFSSDGYELFRNCGFSNCYTTYDKSLVPLYRFDALLFHATYDKDRHEEPPRRYPHQRYIFADMETPLMLHPRCDKIPSYFNWTMTYRSDSDIFRPYAHVIKNETNYVMPTKESLKNKTHLIAWLVSHCSTPHKRGILYHNLHLFFDIHVYGKCGTYKCPGDTKYQTDASRMKCYDYFEKRYKFFLAFENSYCSEYVTEKLFLSLQRNIIPIVYGGADYENIAPPHSVIIAEKFATPRKLAEYILFLSRNTTEYLKYFEWKKHYYIDRTSYRTICELCEKLNDPLEPPKVYKDLHLWWYGESNIHCRAPSEVVNISRYYFTITDP